MLIRTTASLVVLAAIFAVTWKTNLPKAATSTEQASTHGGVQTYCETKNPPCGVLLDTCKKHVSCDSDGTKENPGTCQLFLDGGGHAQQDCTDPGPDDVCLDPLLQRKCL
jgi:hypothetical protein